MRQVSLSEARGKLGELTELAEDVILTDYGKPVGVLLSYEAYEALRVLAVMARDPARLVELQADTARVQRGEIDGYPELELGDEERPESGAVP